MNAFLVWWIVSLVALILFAMVIGKLRTKILAGILIDQRGRYSLNRFQLVMWTLLVLSTFLACVVSSALNDPSKIDQAFAIPATLLTLMGISVGSATVAGAVKSGKDSQGVTQTAGILPAGVTQVNSGLTAQPPVTVAAGGATAIKPHFSQVFLQEEGSQIDQVIDIAKFQNFLFTLALGFTYIVLLCQLTTPGYPDFQDAQHSGNILWLLGISHAGYVAGKLPTKS